MKKENDILTKIDHRDGRTVPEGYFEDFATRMAAELPHQSWEDEPAAVDTTPAKRTLWEKLRPYVYMAAMFAGVWLMMKMFTIGTPPSAQEQLQQNEVLAEALSDGSYVENLNIDVDTDDASDLLTTAYDAGITVDDLRADLYNIDL